MDFGKFFGTAFAESGDKVEIPVESQPSNAVSFTSGYTQDYSLNITTDPRAKSISRTGQNYLFWAITSALGGLQRFGAPSWVGPDDNGGVPLAYPKGARVQQGTEFYVSLVPNNTRALTDSTAWAVATYSPASNAEALTGTAGDLLLTPASLRYVLQNTSIGQPATLTVAGVTRYASAAETQAGAVTNAAVTPAGLKPLADSKLNAANPRTQGVLTLMPAFGAGNTRVLNVETATNDGTAGTVMFSGHLASGRFNLDIHDPAAPASSASVLQIGPWAASAAARSVTVSASLSVSAPISVQGAVNATVLANETVSSTTRLATAEEMAAGSAAVAASPARLSAWTAARYLPIANPVVQGSITVSGGDSGLRWQDPRNGRNLFFTNALSSTDERTFTFNTCNDDGSYNLTAYTIHRGTGRATFLNGITIPAGQTIVAAAPTTTVASVVRMGTQSEVNASTMPDVAVSPATLSGFLNNRYLPLTGGQISGVVALQANDVNTLVWRDNNSAPRYAIATNGTVWALNHFSTSGVYDGSPLIVNQANGETSSNTFRANLVLGGTFRSTSRRDKKTDLRPMTGADALRRLSAYTSWFGRWKPDALGAGTSTAERPFFVADEVFEHAPEVVHVDEDGAPGSVGYVEEIPTLVAAVNFLSQQVAQLQQELRDLRDSR